MPRRHPDKKIEAAMTNVSLGLRYERRAEMNYEFALRFRIPDTSLDQEGLLDALAAHGCDDALPGLGRKGRLALHFNREAATARDALESAVGDVLQALPFAELIEAGPDFVGLSDVAEIIGVSRQNMRKLWLAHPDDFPEPLHEGNPSIWHLAHLLRWLSRRNPGCVSRGVLEVAELAMLLNLKRQVRAIESTH